MAVTLDEYDDDEKARAMPPFRPLPPKRNVVNNADGTVIFISSFARRIRTRERER
jgi:hypothetical protein